MSSSMNNVLLTVVLCCMGMHVAHSAWMLPSESTYSVRQMDSEDMPMPTDAYGDPPTGMIGVCPSALLVPQSTCFCFAIFSGAFSVASDPDLTKEACLGFIGDEETILASEGFCIPFLTKNGTINAELLVGTLNQIILTTCMEDTSPISPIKLACM